MSVSVATTILEQLGGNKFRVMTGARNFLYGDSFLSFRLPGSAGFCKDNINYVKVTLTANDTYNLEFVRIRGTKATPVKTLEDIYFDSLQEQFTEVTGLRTRF